MTTNGTEPGSGGYSPFGLDLFGEPVRQAVAPLAARFVVPPFSVFDARSGDWQERKQAWLATGIESELGRGAVIPGSGAPSTSSVWQFRRDGRWESAVTVGKDALMGSPGGGSIFDPVLTECAYRWFCPPGGLVLDPFAGGSVRGVVAALLGYRYWGVELRPEQVAANERQGRELCPDNPPTWVCGDARALLTDAPVADMVLTCPPYGDLERYSDDPRDLSTMGYDRFMRAWGLILALCAGRLPVGGYLATVVGEYRDPKTGYYRGFVADTVQVARAAGLGLWNDAVLVTAIGTLALRSGQQFAATRKLGKGHQNFLVFRKQGARL